MGSSLTFSHALFHFPPHSFMEFVPALEWGFEVLGHKAVSSIFRLNKCNAIHVAVPQQTPYAGSEISPLSAKTKRSVSVATWSFVH